MRNLVKVILLIVALSALVEAFQFGAVFGYAKEGFNTVRTRFGDKYRHRNLTEGEEVVLDGLD